MKTADDADGADVASDVWTMAEEDTQLRTMTADDGDDIAALAALLPQWFTTSGVEQLKADASHHDGFVATVHLRIIGFVLFVSNDGVCLVKWMGVHPDHRRCGIDRALIEMVEKTCKDGGSHEIRIETLGDGVDYKPDESTRAFYRALGYVEHERRQLNIAECPELLVLNKPLM